VTPASGRRILIICVDAMGPAYLAGARTPVLDRLAEEGFAVTVKSMIPSVTNVNNVSIITGAAPSVHGITSNYMIDRATGREQYMESPEFLRCRTVLQRARKAGMTTALLTSKLKLLALLRAGADFAVAAEDPDEEMIAKIGPAPEIYSAEINWWLFRALRVVLRERSPNLVYCSTTDWAMHAFAPEEPEAIAHLEWLDAILGEVLDENPDLEVYVTADHGMSAKTRGFDVEKVLARQGIAVRAIPIIKDRYVAHHRNLGGASYVYLEDAAQLTDALAILKEVEGIEEALADADAAGTFELAPDRIGDIMVLGDSDTVFGVFEGERTRVSVRSHGSRHESEVPLIARGAPRGASAYRRNLDVVANLSLD